MVHLSVNKIMVVSLMNKSFREMRLFYFLVSLTLLMILPMLYRDSQFSFNSTFLITNASIGIVSIIMIILEARKRRFSLQLVHWIFQYMFFFIAPFAQYAEDAFRWGKLYSNDIELLIMTNLAIILWQTLWIISQLLFKNKKINTNIIESEQHEYDVSKFKKWLLLTLSLVSCLYLFNSYGFSGLFTRGAGLIQTEVNSTLKWFAMYVLRTIPVVFLALLLFQRKNSKFQRNTLLIVVASILVLFSNFPLGLPRFWAATVYLGLFIYIVNPRKNILVYVLLLGLNVIFPLLGSLRGVKSLSEVSDNLNYSGLFIESLLIGDYDAYSMIAYTIEYISEFGITYGKQLLSVFLFFVPSAFWEGKSPGSGYLVANAMGLSFNNVSSPQIAEGLINFGIMGLVIFAIGFALITKKVDNIYYDNPKSKVLSVLYPFWIGMFFFMMRGDLLSTTTFTVAFSLVFFIFKPTIVKAEKTIQ